MDAIKNPEITTVDALVDIINQIFGKANLGLLIYHLEDRKHEGSLKLVYANKAASRYTGSNLQKRIGKYILEAFPALQDTELPRVYAGVVRSGEASLVGAVEYGDEALRSGAYSVKAFPMPADCVAVLFEDIGLQKQIDDLVKRQTNALQQEKDELIKTLASVQSEILELRKSNLSKPDAARVAGILKRLEQRR